MLTLHHTAIREDAPLAIIRPHKEDPIQVWDEAPLPGTWFRVFPQTWNDIQFLRLLDHQVDKFAPDLGHGVLISAEAMDKATPR